MLHAVIRSNQCAIHFFAEVSAGTLRTLGQHVCQACRDIAGLRLRIEMEAAEQPVSNRLLKKDSDALRRAQGERKETMKSGRGSARAELVEASGGVFQQPARQHPRAWLPALVPLGTPADITAVPTPVV